MKRLSDLVGYTLLKMTDRQILVEKDGTYFILDFFEEQGKGDLLGLGYTEVKGYFYPESSCFSYCEAIKEAKITKVEYYYPEPSSSANYVIIKFFFDDECVGRIEAFAGSCIDEKYGTKICVACDRLHFKEVLAEW